jgi:hypothetical protein
VAEFRHRHAAHCESGVTAALLGAAGLELSEPMVFGIGGGVLFFYPPFVRVMGMPLISYRSYPGSIFKLCCKRLGVAVDWRRYPSPERGREELDRFLAEGRPVGLQANMFWLSYFPKEFRSQFNGHNLIALAREGDGYRISDPMLKEPTRLDAGALERARFSKGVLAPRGSLYFPTHIPREVDLQPAVLEAVRDTARKMLAPVPIVGVRGIRRLARHMRGWATKIKDERRRLLLVGHVVRMQEEVGSGGAGFRYLYAAFLQEAGERLEHAPFLEASRQMTEIGDLWRNRFAISCARIIKGRDVTGESLAQASDVLLDCARREEQLFRHLLAHLPERRAHCLATGATASTR